MIMVTSELKKNLNLERDARWKAEAEVLDLREVVATLQESSSANLDDAVQSLCKDLSVDTSSGCSSSLSGSATPVEGDAGSMVIG